MRLDQVLADVEVVELRGRPGGPDVTAITATSRDVRPGSLFCCVRGRVADGHDFAPQAVAAGAVALLCERPVEAAATVPQVVVADSRAAMARAAAALHRHPSRRMAVVGVTGTNGKTTTTHLLKAVLEADGREAEVIGTLSGPRTTPEATELQAALAAAADRGVAAVALEVSSHALALHRVDAIWFSVAVFTNLSPEHLDFHDGMDDYFATKAALFSPERARVAVVNADDPWGRKLLAGARLPTRSFSLADAVGLELGSDGARFHWDGHPVWLRTGGTFNVSNALAAATAARELDVPPAAVAEGLSAALVVPGRFESVDRGQPFRVVVDYAHTPAGLEACLAAARDLAGVGGRVIVVFGCGGDRDHAKRPLMGAVASRLADQVVLTSDNPRSEDPRAILDDVLAGVDRGQTVDVEPDRRAAIALAVGGARPGDVVVVAGKGHETTQVTGADVVPFDDRVVAAEALDRLAAAAGG
ncbi:MAG: UDP-N-acetylmuramoyl-L-alanyl-D-glutamate--2,6-diaminopimelate ligase [Actinomycetota bacterium]|nr:UDP-N-acetylmuramoyl-L-alanyl-D-glutamate--2,6-diaminopimelate ligase [Actinomycetota bacterium]